MNNKHLIALLLLCFLYVLLAPRSLSAQQIYGKPDVWLFWQNQYQFHQKWSFNTEVHARFDNYFQQPEQLLFRPSFQYQYREQVYFAAGYSYVHTFPYGELPLAADRTEHNSWIQLKLVQPINRVKITHRLRLEQRFQSTWDLVEERYNFKKVQYGNRFRYRFQVQIPITERWSVQVFDEFWIRTSERVGEISFDRNWFSVGASYTINKQVKIALSYLHQYIKHSDTLFEQHHTAQLSLQTFITKPNKSSL